MGVGPFRVADRFARGGQVGDQGPAAASQHPGTAAAGARHAAAHGRRRRSGPRRAAAQSRRRGSGPRSATPAARQSAGRTPGGRAAALAERRERQEGVVGDPACPDEVPDRRFDLHLAPVAVAGGPADQVEREAGAEPLETIEDRRVRGGVRPGVRRLGRFGRPRASWRFGRARQDSESFPPVDRDPSVPRPESAGAHPEQFARRRQTIEASRPGTPVPARAERARPEPARKAARLRAGPRLPEPLNGGRGRRRPGTVRAAERTARSVGHRRRPPATPRSRAHRSGGRRLDALPAAQEPGQGGAVAGSASRRSRASVRRLIRRSTSRSHHSTSPSWQNSRERADRPPRGPSAEARSLPGATRSGPRRPPP